MSSIVIIRHRDQGGLITGMRRRWRLRGMGRMARLPSSGMRVAGMCSRVGFGDLVMLLVVVRRGLRRLRRGLRVRVSGTRVLGNGLVVAVEDRLRLCLRGSGLGVVGVCRDRLRGVLVVGGGSYSLSSTMVAPAPPSNWVAG